MTNKASHVVLRTRAGGDALLNAPPRASGAPFQKIQSWIQFGVPSARIERFEGAFMRIMGAFR